MGIVTAIIILGVLVFVHELGHFLVAKYCGVGVLEFAIGFGPVLARWQGKETAYSLRAMPLGGFVRMAGDDPVMVYGESVVGARKDAGGASAIEGVQEDLTPQQQKLLTDESRWFLKKGYWSRCAIVLAGPVANFLFAWVLAFGSFSFFGIPTLADGPVTIGSLHPGLPAEQAGMKVGDKVISVDGAPLTTFSGLVDLVSGSGGRELDIVVKRKRVAGDATAPSGGVDEYETLSFKVKPRADASPEIDALEGRPADKSFRIGIERPYEGMSYTKIGVGQAASLAVAHVVGLSAQTLRILKRLLQGKLSPQKAIGGPIAIISQTAESAKRGMIEIIAWMVFLNVSLGVMNLLPIPVLDGGHLTFFTLEKLRGKPLSMRAQAAFMNVGLIILLCLMVYAVGNDLRRVFF
jgi:regulator of sigma E protease